MLHFLAGLALCIFIGERGWHYMQARRATKISRCHESRMAELLSFGQYKPPRRRGYPWVGPADRLAVALMIALVTAILVGIPLLAMATHS